MNALKLHVQAEHAQAEITRLGGIIGERKVAIRSQKQIIDDLEKSKVRGELMPYSNYILRAESDLVMDALQQQMLTEIESQTQVHVYSCVAQLSITNAALQW